MAPSGVLDAKGDRVPQVLEQLVTPHVASFDWFLQQGLPLLVASVKPTEVRAAGHLAPTHTEPPPAAAAAVAPPALVRSWQDGCCSHDPLTMLAFTSRRQPYTARRRLHLMCEPARTCRRASCLSLPGLLGSLAGCSALTAQLPGTSARDQVVHPLTKEVHRFWFERPAVGKPLHEDALPGADTRCFPRDCREAVRGGGACTVGASMGRAGGGAGWCCGSAAAGRL